jgi:hypothetical protein
MNRCERIKAVLKESLLPFIAIVLSLFIGMANKAIANSNCAGMVHMYFGDGENLAGINTSDLCQANGRNEDSAGCPEGTAVCGAECCPADNRCMGGVCTPICDGETFPCGDTCCALYNQQCINGTCQGLPGPFLYCIASIYKDSACIEYALCHGTVIDVPGYTVQRCSTEPDKPLIYSYEPFTTGSLSKCLYTLCENGVNGRECCPCANDETGEVCLNNMCSMLSFENLKELNNCIGYSDTPDQEEDGDGGGDGEKCPNGGAFDQACMDAKGEPCPTGENYEIQCCCGTCVSGETK